MLKMAFSNRLKILVFILATVFNLVNSDQTFSLKKCCENSEVLDTTTKTCVQSHLSLEELDENFPLNLETEKIYSRNDAFVSGTLR